jgi:hypothetical protein
MPDLTAEQLDKLSAAIGPHLGYLHKLRERMDKIGFVPDDKLRKLVEAAYNAMHSLRVEIHYMAVDAERRKR